MPDIAGKALCTSQGKQDGTSFTTPCNSFELRGVFLLIELQNMKQLPEGQYNFKETEKKILDFWRSKPFFKPEYDPKTDSLQTIDEYKNDNRPKWTLICPPPNAYDRPHMGNLSGYPYMDALGRFHRMMGKRVLLFPGKDHAGIEGEVSYIKYFLEPEGKSKFDFTREEFYNKIYASQQNFIQLIKKDESEIGLSADFDRDLYTMDPKVVNEVLTTFTQMYKDGLIYKGVRIVNWDPKTQSAISDSQCERKEVQGKLYYIKYPIAEGRVWRLSFRIPKILDAIKTGRKTIDIRALNPEEPEKYFGEIKSGDFIICVDKKNGNHLLKKVKEIEIARNWEEAWEKFDWEKIYSDDKPASTLEEMKYDLSKLDTGYAEKIEKNGMVAIHLEDLTESDYLSVATTRPETMLGDTALVVNPADERYTKFIGKKAIIPIANREIPIITNGRIKKEFGTGVLKLTPAHAPEDYEIMLEWNAEQLKIQNSKLKVEEHDNDALIENKIEFDPLLIDYLNIIDRYTKLCGPIPEKYKGLKVNSAREEIVKDLKEQGYLIKEEEITQNLLISERSGAVIEPIMSSQWFIDVSTLKQKMLDVIASGELKIHPKSAEKKYLSWVNNLRDWSISRNLWWGYRLPVWYNGEIKEEIDDNGKVRLKLKVNEDWVELDPTNKEHMKVQIECPGEGWTQDEDILDTWFSSGQWPLICLNSSSLMDISYPTDVLVSGYDLLIKWDLFMVLFGIYKTGKTPFKELFLTGLVKGTDGQKMSKSKRNFVPIDDVKEQFGVDSFRMNCFYQNKAGKAYAITPETLKNFRNFNNKIWNASKFVMLNLADFDSDKANLIHNAEELKSKSNELKFEEDDMQMIEKLIELENKWHEDFEKFRFGSITEKLYSSFWHEFCDIYIEKTKPRVWKDKKTGEYKSKLESRIAAQTVLYYSLKSYLKMLHPFIPFITEEIWQHLVEDAKYQKAMMYM